MDMNKKEAFVKLKREGIIERLRNDIIWGNVYFWQVVCGMHVVAAAYQKREALADR